MPRSSIPPSTASCVFHAPYAPRMHLKLLYFSRMPSYGIVKAMGKFTSAQLQRRLLYYYVHDMLAEWHVLCDEENSQVNGHPPSNLTDVHILFFALFRVFQLL